MKKKIIAAVMAITLLFVVFAMNISAAYVYVYDFSGTAANNIDYTVYLYKDNSTHRYKMVGYTNNNQNYQVRLQCTVCYTDGTYDQDYVNAHYYYGEAYVFYNANKTVSYVDMEMHIYDGNTYIDTVSDTY